MTIYYTQAQIDEIGVFMANKLNESNQALKDFFQEKIDSLAPVTPPAPTEPETGGGTTPAPATGMFLDDGREIKQKLITLEVGYTQSSQAVAHGLNSKDIIGLSVLVCPSPDYLYLPNNESSLGCEYNVYVQAGAYIKFTTSNPNSALKGSIARILITYLA